MTSDEDLRQAIEVMFNKIESTDIRNNLMDMISTSCDMKAGSPFPKLNPADRKLATSQITRKRSSTPSAKPSRRMRSVSTASKALKNAFSARAIGQGKLTDKEIRSKISKMYNDSKVSVDMILAYILLGVNECKEGVVIVENMNNSHGTAIGGNLSMSMSSWNYCRNIMQNNNSTISQVKSCLDDESINIYSWNNLLDPEEQMPMDTLILRTELVGSQHTIPDHVLKCRLNPRPMNYPLCPLNSSPIGYKRDGQFQDKYYYYKDLQAKDRKACFNIESIDAYRKGTCKFVDPFGNNVVLHERLVGALMKSSKVADAVKNILHNHYEYALTDYNFSRSPIAKRRNLEEIDANVRNVRKRAGGGRVLRPLCYAPMSENMTLIGGEFYVDLNELKSNINMIVKDINENYEIIRRLGHDVVFHVAVNNRKRYSGGNKSRRQLFDNSQKVHSPDTSGSESEYYTPESSPESLIDQIHDPPHLTNEDLKKLEQVNINDDSNQFSTSKDEINVGYSSDIAFLGSKGQSHSSKGKRLIMKLGYCDGYSHKHVVVKAALNKEASIDIDNEETIYLEFKSSYRQFYDQNVLKFYGGGLVDGDSIRFMNAEGAIVNMNLFGQHDKLAYVVLEFNPSYVNIHDFLLSKESRLTREVYNGLAVDLMQMILQVHKEANRLCEFGHGDLKSDNVLFDTDKLSVKIFDLEYSSISGALSDIFQTYGNEYLMYARDDYDPVYLWYFDAIRYIIGMRLFDNVDFRYSTQHPFDDIEIERLYVNVKDYVLKHEIDLIKGWNGSQQSHEFISTMMRKSSE